MLLFYLSLLTLPALPQPALSGPTLTMRAAVEEAVANNPDLRVLRAEIRVAEQRPAQQRGLPPPMLEGQIWQWPIDTVNPADAAMYMVMGQQLLPGRGKRGLAEALARKDLELAEAAVPVRARDIVASVQRTYADLYLARKAIEISGRTAAILKQVADASQVRYAAARGEQQDVLEAIVEMSRLEAERVTLSEQARVLEARLNTLLARPAEAPVGPLADPAPPAPLPDPATLQRMAVERQPDLARSRVAIERAQAAEALAGRLRAPDYTIKAGYMLMPRNRDAWTASISVSWPDAPWSKGRTAAAIAEASADVAAARARYDAAAASLRLMVQEAWVRAAAAAARADLLKGSVLPQANHALEAAQIGYQGDRGGLLSVIESQRAAVDAELDYYGALADVERARADLERAVGVPIHSLTAAGGAQ
jgi:cobalt-zinc-cadmium efflux system outer membrane protein